MPCRCWFGQITCPSSVSQFLASTMRVHGRVPHAYCWAGLPAIFEQALAAEEECCLCNCVGSVSAEILVLI